MLKEALDVRGDESRLSSKSLRRLANWVVTGCCCGGGGGAVCTAVNSGDLGLELIGLKLTGGEVLKDTDRVE